jgi:hypothetical protein
VTNAERRLDDVTGTALLVAASLGLVLFAACYTAVHGLDQPRIAVAFGAVVAVGELVRITLPGDREAAPLGAAGALAYALLTTVQDTPTTHDLWQVVAVTSIATLVGAMPHVAAGRAPRLEQIARRVLTTAFAAAIFRPLYLQDAFRHDIGWIFALELVFIAGLVLLFDAALAAIVRADRDRAPFGRAVVEELRAVIGLGSAIGATGVLIALAARITGLSALPVFCLPLLLTQFSYRRYASIRQTYLQTIRSLARVTEVGGYTEPGHVRRVADLSVAVGTEMGLSDAQLRDLEYAALMHDLGQLSLAEPIPGGATVFASLSERDRIAMQGADVIRQTGVLDRVALIVERQADPYRRPHEQMDGSLPLASRIIKAVNAYDDLVGSSLDSGRRLEAVEQLRLGMVYNYDPQVVATLARVVERHSVRVGA